MLEIGLITGMLVLITLIIVLIWLDRDGIALNMKLKFSKGHVMTIVIGKDKRIYLNAVKVGGKSTETNEIRINNNPYTFDPSRIYLYKDKPILIYYEGVTMPLMIDTQNKLGYGKLTPELLNQIIVTARQSGAIPKKETGMEMFKTIATFGAFFGVIVVGYLVYQLGGNVDKLTPALNTMYEGIKTLLNSTMLRP